MSNDQSAKDPLEFVRGMWSNMGFNLPGMVTPTLDVEELDKRIADMRAVEGWLKMNLNMLQMTIQGLDMQRATIAAVTAMSQHMQDSGGDKRREAAKEKDETQPGDANPFAAAAAMWPWNMMNAAQGEPGAPKPEAAADNKAKPRRKAAEK